MMYSQHKIRALVIGIIAIIIFAFTPASFLGAYDKTTFWTLYAFTLVGQWFSLTYIVSKRNPNKAGSPIKHDTLYMLVDNALKIVTTLVLSLLAVRFLPDLIEVLSANFTFFKTLFAQKLTDAAAAMVVGGSLYWIVEFIAKMKKRVTDKDSK